MCGLAGFLGGSALAHDAWPALLTRMGAAIGHRGPDDAGLWTDVDGGIGLVHRRLSIVDLSPAGHQPMASPSARFILVFNGEIYNHLELRESLSKLADVGWRGHSDTEVLLTGFDKWGIQETIKRAVGMFAFAVWDRRTRALTLGRDRLGEKPLYYGWQGQGREAVFLFGSELKALKVHPAFDGEVDRGALCLQLRHNCIPAPYSIYKGIRKLEPGTLLRVEASAKRSCDAIVFWSFADVVAAGQTNPFDGNDAEAIESLDTLLRQAISGQMMADVPLGAFLSGGVDSSTIVALMQAQASRPVKTFSIGFNEAGYDEAQHAKAVARHLGTEHTELYVSSAQAMGVIALLPTLYDEPFSDSSQIPTYLLSQMTRSHVSVSLSGDAGDELFGGYGRYQKALRLRGKIPGDHMWLQRVAGAFAGVAARLDRRRADSWQQLRDLLDAVSAPGFYLPRVSHWKRPAEIVVDGQEALTVFTQASTQFAESDFLHMMMAMDSISYLPDDILVKVDRAAMGVSLETRVPLLDHRVVEFAWRLPMHMKIRNGQGKWILRQVLAKYVPTKLTERPKMGFGVPIDSWLRGPLRDWAEELLSESRLRREGFFRPRSIRHKWLEHLSGRRNWQYHLWDILMFQAWLQHERRAT